MTPQRAITVSSAWLRLVRGEHADLVEAIRRGKRRDAQRAASNLGHLLAELPEADPADVSPVGAAS